MQGRCAAAAKPRHCLPLHSFAPPTPFPFSGEDSWRQGTSGSSKSSQRSLSFPSLQTPTVQQRTPSSSSLSSTPNHTPSSHITIPSSSLSRNPSVSSTSSSPSLRSAASESSPASPTPSEAGAEPPGFRTLFGAYPQTNGTDSGSGQGMGRGGGRGGGGVESPGGEGADSAYGLPRSLSGRRMLRRAGGPVCRWCSAPLARGKGHVQCKQVGRHVLRRATVV